MPCALRAHRPQNSLGSGWVKPYNHILGISPPPLPGWVYRSAHWPIEHLGRGRLRLLCQPQPDTQNTLCHRHARPCGMQSPRPRASGRNCACGRGTGQSRAERVCVSGGERRYGPVSAIWRLAGMYQCPLATALALVRRRHVTPLRAPRSVRSAGVAGRRTRPPQGTEGDEAAWFAYYSGRMGARRRVRRLMRLYIPFLPRSSQMALMPGTRGAP